MGVLLICDVAGCHMTTPPVVVSNRPTAPPNWWMQVNGDRFVVACCVDHLNIAVKTGSVNT